VSVTVRHSKTLIAPDSGTEDKVYGVDYVALDSHVITGLGTAAEASTSDFDAAGVASAAVVAHEAASDPHPVYLTQAEADALFLTPAEGNAAYDAIGAAAAVAAAAVLDGDAAAGDLGGAYPSPTVTQARGLRETTGPTTLALGAVADGEFLRRVGATVVGASPGAGSFTATQATVTLPYVSTRHSVSVTDANVSSSSKIILSLAGVAETDTNASDSIDVLSMMAVPATGSFLFQALFLTPIGGPLKINYAVG
jgi:hypothetical protein